MLTFSIFFLSFFFSFFHVFNKNIYISQFVGKVNLLPATSMATSTAEINKTQLRSKSSLKCLLHTTLCSFGTDTFGLFINRPHRERLMANIGGNLSLTKITITFASITITFQSLFIASITLTLSMLMGSLSIWEA